MREGSPARRCASSRSRSRLRRSADAVALLAMTALATPRSAQRHGACPLADRLAPARHGAGDRDGRFVSMNDAFTLPPDADQRRQSPLYPSTCRARVQGRVAAPSGALQARSFTRDDRRLPRPRRAGGDHHRRRPRAGRRVLIILKTAARKAASAQAQQQTRSAVGQLAAASRPTSTHLPVICHCALC